VPPRQSQGNHQLTGQPAEGSGPPGQGPLTEGSGPPGQSPQTEGSGPPGQGPQTEGSGPPGQGPQTEGSGQPGQGPKTEGSGPPGQSPQTEGSGPPGQGPRTEWLSHQLHPQCFCPPPPQALDPRGPEEDQEEESRSPVMMIPYVAGMSEDIRRVCRKFDIRVVFKSRRTLCLMLTRVKDTLHKSNVVYCIPCSCSQVYIGETKRRLQTRLKEHPDTCERDKKGGTVLTNLSPP